MWRKTEQKDCAVLKKGVFRSLEKGVCRRRGCPLSLSIVKLSEFHAPMKYESSNIFIWSQSGPTFVSIFYEKWDIPKEYHKAINKQTFIVIFLRLIMKSTSSCSVWEAHLWQGVSKKESELKCEPLFPKKRPLPLAVTDPEWPCLFVFVPCARRMGGECRRASRVDWLQ